MRPSYEALPSWLSRVPEVPPTPVMASRPLEEEGVLRRTLGNPRLQLHVVLFAVALGIGAAVAARSVGEKRAAESRAEMSAFAERKVAELRAFGTLRSAPARAAASPLAPGGSVAEDVPGYSDVVDGTEGRRFHRRWVVDLDSAGLKRLIVRVMPASREAGQTPLDVTTVLSGR